MEELVEVTVLIEGLMPYAGYTPVMAAVWDTHAAGGGAASVLSATEPASVWAPSPETNCQQTRVRRH
ncbi:hypothetical protein EYF80_012661 [Liparis tanakae]|uniref:Uncharacterized protein n=1 Tax=Liparis tanakae TaxID=230148 RepID=A0A4Z2III6_9TELE|nr:hypothetical protein EYF80_012661 [Liparis tanakae]